MICPRCWGTKQVKAFLQSKVCGYCTGAGVVADFQLSANFMLSEALHSEIAVRKGLDNSPSPQALSNLSALFMQLVQPIRNHFGPLHVNSAYRRLLVNRAVGGSDTSAHPFGWAGDLVPVTYGLTIREMVEWVAESDLPFDQVIYEGTWMHVGLLKEGVMTPRKQVLMAFGGQYFDYDKNDPRIV
jgi:hypothetical protein